MKPVDNIHEINRANSGLGPMKRDEQAEDRTVVPDPSGHQSQKNEGGAASKIYKKGTGGRRRIVRHVGSSGRIQTRHSVEQDVTQDTSVVEATFASGLKPGILTLASEKRHYGGNRARYIKVRDYILKEWYKERDAYLTSKVCLENYKGEEAPDFVGEVYSFLHQQGCINFGILKNDPLVPVAVESFGRGSQGASPNFASEEPGGYNRAGRHEPEDDAIAGALYSIISKVDMDTTSEKTLREMLASHFNLDMETKHRKNLVKRLIAEYIECGGLPQAWKKRHFRGKNGKFIVVGAGPAGLTAALHLKRHGCDVTVIEARDRVGGRINSYTGKKFNAPCDLGASIITGREVDGKKGLRADPSALLCWQLGLTLHDLNEGVLPLYDVEKRSLVDEKLDSMVEKIRDELMDRAAAYCESLPVEDQEQSSFGELLKQARIGWTEETMDRVRRKMERAEQVVLRLSLQVNEDGQVRVSIDLDMSDASLSDDDAFPPELFPQNLSDDHDRLLGWHWANLEYGCSAPLGALSAPHWNQDEDFGGFGGPHCFVVGGYDQPFKHIAELLDVEMGKRVSAIHVDDEKSKNSVSVQMVDGTEMHCDGIVVTVPLGVLKQQSIKFIPDLPQWKKDSIERLGFGKLDKVFLQFEDVFWDDSVDFFGAANGSTESTRGCCFMFWNIHRFSGVPILAALISGESAHVSESAPEEELRSTALDTLQSVFKDKKVPIPIAYHVTRWGSDIDTRGSYSFVALGSSGKDYEMLARPVGRKIFFAGEHTCQEHPDTVGGAMLTGMREASRILELLDDGLDKSAGTMVNVTKKRKALEEEDEEYRNTDFEKKDRDIVDMLISRDEREATRMAQRLAAKDMWKGLMAAETGDTSIILTCLRGADGPDTRHAMANPLVEATPAALACVFGDEECMNILLMWLDELSRKQAFAHIVTMLLKAFAVPDWSTIPEGKSKDYLVSIVRKLVQHQDDGVKMASRRVLQHIQNLRSNSDFELEPTIGVTRKASQSTEVILKIDEDTKLKLEEAEAELKAMQAEADKLRAEAEMHAVNVANAELDSPVFGTFEEYRDSLRNKKKKQRTRIARKIPEQSEHPYTKSADPRDVFRRRIDGCVAEALKPHYESRKISKDTYKTILKKAGDKIMAKVTERDVTDWKQFLRARKDSIPKLVDGYVEAYRGKR
jgi:monoamine oxidase